MKFLAVPLFLASLSLACQHPLVPSGWRIDPKTVITDSAMIDGKLEPWGKAVAYMNYSCPDLVIAVKKYSAERKAKVGK